MIDGNHMHHNASSNTTGVAVPPKTKPPTGIDNSFLSRKMFYKFLESKMSSFGLNGSACLLKTICQVAEVALGRNNGVLGDIVHVMFT